MTESNHKSKHRSQGTPNKGFTKHTLTTKSSESFDIFDSGDSYSSHSSYDSMNSKKSSKSSKSSDSKMSKKVYWIIVGIVVVIVALVCVIGYRKAYNICYDVAIDPSDTSKVEYTIDSSTTKEDIENYLVSNGFVKDMSTLKAREKLYDADYQEGTYKISKSYTTEKIINILSGYDYSNGTMEE